MRKQYLHVSVHSCNKCQGPVVSASLAVRENAISKETDIRRVGAICLSCGHRQPEATGMVTVRHFSPVECEPADAIDLRNLTTAFVEALNRADLHRAGMALSRIIRPTERWRATHPFDCGRVPAGFTLLVQNCGLLPVSMSRPAEQRYPSIESFVRDVRRDTRSHRCSCTWL